MFIRPCYGRITSSFQKNRLDPVGGKIVRNHVGTDFGNHANNTIVASAGGKVTRAGVLGGFGNCVMILHSIGGVSYETVYAHLASIDVKVGTTVAQGKRIGIKGNTGNSTGIHLHFEIHRGRWNANNKGVLDPELYMSDPDILALQKLLRSAGYIIELDGINGPGTKSAVITFQKLSGLAVDGSAGPATLAKLKEVVALSKTRFSDVPKNHTAYNALERLVKAGIVNGYPDNTFKPNEPITRAHVAVIVDRAIQSLKG